MLLLLLQAAADESRSQLAGVLGTLLGLSVLACGTEGAAASEAVNELSDAQVRGSLLITPEDICANLQSDYHQWTCMHAMPLQCRFTC